MKTSYGFNSTGKNTTYGLSEEGKQFIQWCQDKKFKDSYKIDWSIGSVTSSDLCTYSDALLNYASGLTEKDYSIENDVAETSENTYFLHIKVPKAPGYALQMLTYCYLKDMGLITNDKINKCYCYLNDYITGNKISVLQPDKDANKFMTVQFGSGLYSMNSSINLDYGDSSYYYQIKPNMNVSNNYGTFNLKLLKMNKSDNSIDSEIKTIYAGSTSYYDKVYYCLYCYNNCLYVSLDINDVKNDVFNIGYGPDSIQKINNIDISNKSNVYTDSLLNDSVDNYSKHIDKLSICDESNPSNHDWLAYKKVLVNNSYYDLTICISGKDSNGNPVINSSNASNQDYITKNTNTDSSDGTDYKNNGQQDKDDSVSGISSFLNDSNILAAMQFNTDMFNKLFNLNNGIKLLVIVSLSIGLITFVIGRRTK